MDEDHPFQDKVLPALLGCSERNVMGDISAGAVASEEAFREIGMLEKPGLGVSNMGCIRRRSTSLDVSLLMKPEEGIEAIVVRGRKMVFGSEAIFNGNDEGIGKGSELREEVMVMRTGGATDAEGTTMEVEEQGKFG